MLYVFDLDHTLLKGNISVYFGRLLWRNSFISLRSFVSLVWAYCSYHLRFSSLENLHKIAFESFFKARTFASFSSLFKECSAELPSLFRKEILSQLQGALARGDRVALLSSSPDFLVNLVAQHLGIDICFASEYVLEKGCFTRINSILTGDKKADLLEKIQKRNEKVFVFSDSIEDLPLLLKADKVLLVDPDRLLRKIAHKKSWSILEAKDAS